MKTLFGLVFMSSRPLTTPYVCTDDYWPLRLAGELQESVPLRDFVRPVPYRVEQASVAILLTAAQQQRLGQWGHADPRALQAWLLACLATLLARHTGQTDVLLSVCQTGTDAPGLPLRCLWKKEIAWPDFLKKIAVSLRADLAHKDSFFLWDKALPGRVCLSLQETATEAASHAAKALRDTVEISFDFRIEANGLQAKIHYNTLIYRTDSLVVIARQMAQVMACTLENPDQLLGFIGLHDAREKQRILYDFNDKHCVIALDQTLSALIEQQVARTPELVCAVEKKKSLTFQVLNANANQLAGLLQTLGVGPGCFVAILAPRGLHFVTAMLAIWKAGGAYLPVEPGYPEDRVRYMLTQSETPVVLVGRAELARMGELTPVCPQLASVVCLEAIDVGAAVPIVLSCHLYSPPDFIKNSIANIRSLACAQDPAYMVYTSGSTGLPKGAIVCHDGAVNHLLGQAHCLGAESIKNFLQSAPSSSDISVWQFAAPLVLGGKTVIIDSASDVENLIEQVRCHRLGILEVVPVVLKHLINYLASLPVAQRLLPDLRWAMVTGESAPVELVNAWLALYPQIPVINAYGPTEAADDITQAIIDQPLFAHQLVVPIGRPLPNLAIYILDQAFEPVPIGAPGQICVAGVGVGKGYWRQPEKTRESFKPNPFPDSWGPLMYCTGDTGRFRDDGTIECLGRQDHQIQLNGFRIELSEIEGVLRTHPQVKEAVVLAVHGNQARRQLAAFVVPTVQATDDTLDSSDLRRFMRARLPIHMVPLFIVGLHALPLNPAGKIDRQALATHPLPQALTSASDDVATTDIEKLFTQLWCDELGQPHIGLHDNFFDLGGDSLTAVALVAGARHAGWRIRPSDIFDHPTVAALAQVARPATPQINSQIKRLISQHSGSDLSAEQRLTLLQSDARLEDAYALSPTQQGIYLHLLLSRNKSVYIDQYCSVWQGRLDPDVFRMSWTTVLQRHSALRSTVSRRHARRPVQLVFREASLPFDYLDWSGLAAHTQTSQLACLREAEINRGFDLDCVPLMRLTLVRLSTQTHELIWTHHHLILDGWSMTQVLREVMALMDNSGAPLKAVEQAPEAASNHRRYVDWLQARDLSADQLFWKKTLAGLAPAAPLLLPVTYHPQPTYASHDGFLSASQTRLLVDFARGHGVTLGTVLHAAWALLLSQLSGSDDVLFGMVSSGREIELEDVDVIVGLLVTTLPLRVDTAVISDLRHWLLGIQRDAASIRSHDALGLTAIQKCRPVLSDKPLFDTLFVIANYPQPVPTSTQSLTLTASEFRTMPAYAITLVAVPGECLLLRLSHDQLRYDTPVARQVLNDYQALLVQLMSGQVTAQIEPGIEVLDVVLIDMNTTSWVSS